VEAKCTDDCANPADRNRNNKDAVQGSPYNKTASFLANINETTKFVGRDLGQITQYEATGDLRFISQSPSAANPDPDSLGPYNYDASAGKNAIIYILDPEWFDLSLPVSRYTFRFRPDLCFTISFVRYM
jgi:hypothetical protein